MTNARTCLRCDWQGETDESTCPDCAAPLYELGRTGTSEGAGAEVRSHPEERSREAASTAIVAPSSAPPRPSSPPTREFATEAAEPSTTRSKSLVAIVVAVIVMAVAVGSWLNAHEAPLAAESSLSRQAHLSGTLVYAVPDGEDRSRLWRWDLATGAAVRGSRVPRAIELIDARGVNSGAVGLTSELPNGQVQASILRFLGPDDRPTPVLKGDVVSWGPQGTTVLAGRRGPLRAGCRRSVSIVWARLVPALRERKYADPSLCGDLLSIGLDNQSTMFTLDRGGRVGIYFAGIGRIHRVLDGYAMVAVSALSDLIVVPQASLAALRPLAARPEQARADLLGAGLYFQGSGEGRPLPYRDGPFQFAVARMLTWSPSGASAVVVGSQGFRRGFYLLDTASGDGLDTPTYVGPVSGIPYGTITSTDDVIVETSEGLFVSFEGELVRIEPPVDAPAPNGPIVWIR
jgi:hypothetical protein